MGTRAPERAIGRMVTISPRWQFGQPMRMSQLRFLQWSGTGAITPRSTYVPGKTTRDAAHYFSTRRFTNGLPHTLHR